MRRRRSLRRIAVHKIPRGGFCATAEDLARFAIAVQTEVLVSKVTLAQMFVRQKTRDGRDVPFGLGWIIGVQAVQKEVWHMGEESGFLCGADRPTFACR
jgi:CubicO group peptidase (beta-lactamase class C family)